MKDFHYLLENFFTHKDFLAPAAEIPGTMFTPLHLLFAAAFLTLLCSSAVYVAHRKRLLKPVLASVWAMMLVWEFVIIGFDSFAGSRKAFDFTVSLSLYPCSLYLYTMPLILWGKGSVKQACCGYLCTLGLLGALVNLLFPVTRLFSYSCLSFAGLHTLCFHGAMFFSYLIVVISGYHRYEGVTTPMGLLLPSIPTLILSIPANLLNYTIGSDYMFFRGQFFVLQKIFRDTRPVLITLTLYLLYVLVPALFYIPGYLHHRRQEEEEEPVFLTAGPA